MGGLRHDVRARRIDDPPALEGLFLVSLLPASATAMIQEAIATDATEAPDARQRYESAMQQLETANQELTPLNQEIRSANQELKSSQRKRCFPDRGGGR